jgi:hypothetical protein
VTREYFGKSPLGRAKARWKLVVKMGSENNQIGGLGRRPLGRVRYNRLDASDEQG